MEIDIVRQLEMLDEAGRLDIVGVAPGACLIANPSYVAGANSTFAASGGLQGRVDITQLADPQTAEPIASSVNLAVPIICNTAHRLSLTTANGGLLRAGGAAALAPANGFREFLPYQVNATWAGQSVTATSRQGETAHILSSDGAAGQLDLVITVPGGGGPMAAGQYGDDLVVRLQVAN